jgi:glutathione S-transferase
LSYKRLPFNTIWVEYPDVEETLKAAGIVPSSIKPDGTPLYTLPAIIDPATGAALSDSFIIAEYLDKTYPDTPSVIPPGTRALQSAFLDAIIPCLAPMFPFGMKQSCDALMNPKSEDYFRRTRKELVLGGKSVDEIVPQGESAKEEWKKFETGFGKMAGWMNKEDKFIMGDHASLADFAIGGWLMYCKHAWGGESQQWKDIASWNDGRWGKLLKTLESYFA